MVFSRPVTDLETAPVAAPLPDGPHDVEFFLDPGCPFAWQTSRWLLRVAALRDLSIGWRFISLKVINEAKDPNTLPPQYKEHAMLGHRILRIAAAVRDKVGNDGVERLYTAWGERIWNTERNGRDYRELRAELTTDVDFGALLESADLPAELAEAAEDEAYDDVLSVESAVAFDRAGNDLGTPIITYGEGGPTYFGPVISSVPADDDDVVRLYDAIRTLGDLGGTFSELKRTKRPPLDLPILNG